MNDYKEIVHNEVAIKYAKDLLSKGHTLSRILFQDIDFSSGKIITYLPKESIQMI